MELNISNELIEQLKESSLKKGVPINTLCYNLLTNGLLAGEVLENLGSVIKDKFERQKFYRINRGALSQIITLDEFVQENKGRVARLKGMVSDINESYIWLIDVSFEKNFWCSSDIIYCFPYDFSDDDKEELHKIRIGSYIEGMIRCKEGETDTLKGCNIDVVMFSGENGEYQGWNYDYMSKKFK